MARIPRSPTFPEVLILAGIGRAFRPPVYSLLVGGTTQSRCSMALAVELNKRFYNFQL